MPKHIIVLGPPHIITTFFFKTCFFEKKPSSRLSYIVQPGRPIDYQLKVVGWIAGFYQSSYSQGFFFKFSFKEASFIFIFPHMYACTILLLRCFNLAKVMGTQSSEKRRSLVNVLRKKVTRFVCIYAFLFNTNSTINGSSGCFRPPVVYVGMCFNQTMVHLPAEDL